MRTHDIRPWSVDSLNGGSTDALKKAPVEKKIMVKIWYVHIFASTCIRSTEKYNHLKWGGKGNLNRLKTF